MSFHFQKAVVSLGSVQVIVGVLQAILYALIVAGATDLHVPPPGYTVLADADFCRAGIVGGILTIVAGIVCGIGIGQTASCGRIAVGQGFTLVSAFWSTIPFVFSMFWTQNWRDPAMPTHHVAAMMAFILSVANIMVSTLVVSFLCINSPCCYKRGGVDNGPISRSEYAAVLTDGLADVVTEVGQPSLVTLS